ncbi:MAG: hypothetical protein OXO50_08210 [Caldilineaceae bacterium]|nr:hypothetical protein [Caldilineaceae bacterium]
MNSKELHAKQWLQRQGYDNMHFVPDPNDQPPDFIVNDSIAVEVTRLNLMFGDQNTGLESIEIPLSRTIRSALNDAPQPPPGCKIFVRCDLFGVDLPKKDAVIREIQRTSSDYVQYVKHALRQNQKPSFCRDEADFGMSIRFATSTDSLTNEFKLEQVSAGIGEFGQISSDSIDNINRCIDTKTDKIRDKHDLYTEWWLILAEHNINTTELRHTDELQAVKDNLTDTSLWSRIIVISNLNGMPHLVLI